MRAWQSGGGSLPPGVPPGDDPAPDAAVLAPLFERLRAESFDVAVQLHGGGANSNPVVRRLGARVTAGSRADDAPALDRTVHYEVFQPEVLRYLEVVGLVGAYPVGLEPALP